VQSGVHHETGGGRPFGILFLLAEVVGGKEILKMSMMLVE